MSVDMSPQESDEGNSDGRAAFVRELVGSPARLALFMLLFVLLVSVILRFELPGEFWAVLTGLVTGAAQEFRRESD